MKKVVKAGFAAAWMFSGTVQAEAILWYRFDGEGATVVNKANPGTMDGTLKSIDTWGGLSGLGNTAAKFPERIAAFPERTRLLDPLSNTIYSNAVTGLSWSGQANDSGIVFLSKADAAPLIDLKTFTCECFFYMPAEVASRSGDPLYAFVNWGNDMNEGWKFSIWDKDISGTHLTPHVRVRLRKKDGTAREQASTWYPSPACLSTNTWHHVAFSVDGAGDGSSATLKIYLDYHLVVNATIKDYYGFYFNEDRNYALTVGADLYRSHKNSSFFGKMAEFRISDTALTPDQLLRPLPDGPVDADTLFYLPLGENAWFSHRTTTNFHHDGVALSSAFSPWRPAWRYGSYSERTDIPPMPVVAEDAPVATSRAGVLAAEGFGNTSSLKFSRYETASGTFGSYQHALFVPDETNALQQDDFTLEFSFKIPTPLNSATNGTMTLVYANWGKICVYDATHGLLVRPYLESGGTMQNQKYNGVLLDTDSNAVMGKHVDDNQWHHVAFVWEQGTSNMVAYLDHVRLCSKVVPTGLQHTGFMAKGFYIGCENGLEKQGFGGYLDDVRLTRRALRPHEFLTSRVKPGAADVLFHARFENDYASGLGEDIVADGVARQIYNNTVGAGAVPTFQAHSASEKLYDDLEDKEPSANTGYVRIQGGEIYWPRNSLLERDRVTVEFFGAFQGSVHGANIIRFSPDYDPVKPNPYGKPGTPLWGIYLKKSGETLQSWQVVTLTCTNDVQRRLLQIDTHDSSKNAARGRRDIAIPAIQEMDDGKWHHWVLTFEATDDGNTVWAFWCDYNKVHEATVSGTLYTPVYGSVFEIGGTTSTTALLNGRIDEIRISDGVLPPEKFMRRGAFGFLLICR